jgi:hypothetical protein
VEEHSDRAECIIMSSMIERMIEMCIIYRIGVITSRDELLFKSDGALSSFNGNIDLAYAINLITSDLRYDLHVLRLIRNLFAHSALYHLTFDTPDIDKLILKFKHLSDENTVKKDDNGNYLSATGKVLNNFQATFLRAWISISQRLMESMQQVLKSQQDFLNFLKTTSNKDC